MYTRWKYLYLVMYLYLFYAFQVCFKKAYYFKQTTRVTYKLISSDYTYFEKRK